MCALYQCPITVQRDYRVFTVHAAKSLNLTQAVTLISSVAYQSWRSSVNPLRTRVLILPAATAGVVLGEQQRTSSWYHSRC